MNERAEPHVTVEAEAASRVWREKAADVMLVVIAIAILPQIFLWIVGYELPDRRQLLLLTLVLVFLALLAIAARRWPLVTRVWITMLVMYIASVHGLVWYTGALARVWLVGAPILGLILAGPRSAGAAALISVGIIVLHAVASAAGVADLWHVAGFDESHTRVVVARAAMWLAFFIPTMLLLRRFQEFQMQTLAAERRTSAKLETEVAQHRAALDSLARAAAERERLEREIARVADDERRRLGHDLHDGVGQQLAGALLRCSVLQERLEVESPDRAADARALAVLLDSALDEVHEVARSLSPVDMDPAALGHALGVLARRAEGRFGVRCDYHQSGHVWLNGPERTLHLYRIAQEAVQNAGRHAHARRIAVTLSGNGTGVLLTVEDDGNGLPDDTPHGGMGLRIMAFRAQRIGGTLRLEQPSDGGTRVVCNVPGGAHDEP